MKRKLKKSIQYFTGNLDEAEKMIPVQSLSVYFSVAIACLTLKSIRGGSEKKEKSSWNRYEDLQEELKLINQRFPELVDEFHGTHCRLRKDLACQNIDNLLNVFKAVDDDIDDLISWSYQYLKKDLEKAAFSKIGKDKTKIAGSDLLFTTQFFTDRYMVKYLVNQALSIHPEKTTDYVIIDPASGGGNFLNFSFERLYELNKKQYSSKTSQELVDDILNNYLVGYDLDYNLSKVASLSLFVKACSYATPSQDTQIYIYGGIQDDMAGFLGKNVRSNVVNGYTFQLKLQEIIEAKYTKIFVTNPPFMGKRDMDTGLKQFLMSNFPEGKGDLCVSFLQKTLSLMTKEDVFGVVTQNNWLYLSSMMTFRKLFLKEHSLKQCLDLGSNAFADINGEKSNIALCVINGSTSNICTFYNLKFISSKDKQRFVRDEQIPPGLTYTLDQLIFLKNEDLEFSYQLDHKFNNLEKLSKYGQFANPMQGTSTGNNTEFVKYAWEVNNNTAWKPVSKGGGYSKWAGLNYHKVLWGKNAEIIKTNKGSALRNIDKIASTELVFSDTGTLGLNVRVLEDGQVFIASGPGIQVLQGDKHAHMAFLNSRVATFLLKLMNPKLTISAGYIAKIPVANRIIDSEFIANRSKRCLELKRQYLSTKLPNLEFKHHDYRDIRNLEDFLHETINIDLENDYKRLLLEFEIEEEILKRFEFTEIELKEISAVVGISPFNCKTSNDIIPVELDVILSSSLNNNCAGVGKILNGYSVGSESLIEILSYKLNVNPKKIITAIKKDISLYTITKSKYYMDLLHKIMIFELGVCTVSSVNSKVATIGELYSSLTSKYPFLAARNNLLREITSVISAHHPVAFMNKPFIRSLNDIIMVGFFKSE